jgi:intracellular septation protein
MKTLLDLGPALLFFGVYIYSDIYIATAALIGALLAVVLAYRLWKGEWHKAHAVAAVVAAVLGGLTLYIRDPAFIQYKPTAVYGVFALALLLSHVIGDRVLLARLPQKTVQLPDTVWRRLNLAWALFFVFCAGLNVWVAANFDEATWVQVKTFGFSALMFLFLLAHLPFLSRYLPDEAR